MMQEGNAVQPQPVGAQVRSLVDGHDLWSKVRHFDFAAIPELAGLVAEKHLEIGVQRNRILDPERTIIFRMLCVTKLTHIEFKFDVPILFLPRTHRVVSAQLAKTTMDGDFGTWLTLTIAGPKGLSDLNYLLPELESVH